MSACIIACYASVLPYTTARVPASLKWVLLDCRTELHFVRCIKPNNEQAQEDYDAALVLHQLRCCGITEVARIARAGYPTRYAHQQFAQRYSSLLGNRAPRKPLCPPCNR